MAELQLLLTLGPKNGPPIQATVREPVIEPDLMIEPELVFAWIAITVAFTSRGAKADMDLTNGL